MAAASTWGWWGASDVEEDTAFVVPSGSSLTSVAHKLEDEELIGSADSFLLWAKLLGSGDPIKAGEFLLPAGASGSEILDTFQHGEVIRRFITIPEGLPSISVYERLMAEPLLTGSIPVPESLTLTVATVGVRSRRMAIVPPRGVNFTALPRMFVMT